MSKLANGPASSHVEASHGSAHYPLNFYSTTYSVHHGKEGDGSRATPLRHHGTGYMSNFRPALYYTPGLDDVDNPHMRKLLTDNDVTLTKKDYTGYAGPDGRGILPRQVHSGKSGYGRSMPRTLPVASQVRAVHVDTSHDGTVPILPRDKPLLRSTEPKDPITNENGGHGPRSMSTEYHTRFPRQPFRPEGCASRYSRQEDSGFTHAHNIEPITYRPQDNHSGLLPGNMTWRPTGNSIMKVDFKPTSYMKGGECLPAVSAKADRRTGFVKGNENKFGTKGSEVVGSLSCDQVHPQVLERVKKQDPAEYSTVTHPHQYSSLTQCSFQGRLKPWTWQREDVGRKELTGFSENNCPKVEPAYDTNQFTTHYHSRFPTPSFVAYHSALPCGRPGVQPPSFNGYSKSTQVHRYSTAPNIHLNEIHPYVARSIMKRHPYHFNYTRQRTQTV